MPSMNCGYIFEFISFLCFLWDTISGPVTFLLMILASTSFSFSYLSTCGPFGDIINRLLFLSFRFSGPSLAKLKVGWSSRTIPESTVLVLEYIKAGKAQNRKLKRKVFQLLSFFPLLVPHNCDPVKIQLLFR